MTDSNVSLLKDENYSIVYMYHSFLIHSSVDGHLGCFCILATVNSVQDHSDSSSASSFHLEGPL